MSSVLNPRWNKELLYWEEIQQILLMIDGGWNQNMKGLLLVSIANRRQFHFVVVQCSCCNPMIKIPQTSKSIYLMQISNNKMKEKKHHCHRQSNLLMSYRTLKYISKVKKKSLSFYFGTCIWKFLINYTFSFSLPNRRIKVISAIKLKSLSFFFLIQMSFSFKQQKQHWKKGNYLLNHRLKKKSGIT